MHLSGGRRFNSGSAETIQRQLHSVFSIILKIGVCHRYFAFNVCRDEHVCRVNVCV